jgi:hypothetical protein
MGPKNTVYPFIKLRKPEALRISSATKNGFLFIDIPGEDFPWAQRPATDERTKYLPTTNIDVSWTERCHIVARTKRVGGDVCAKRCKNKRESRKEGSSTVVPLINKSEGIPQDLTVKNGAGGSHSNPDKGTERECDWYDYRLNILTS